MKILKTVYSIEVVILSFMMFLPHAQAEDKSDNSLADQAVSNSGEKPKKECNDNYEIDGYDIDWMPVCIYDDGENTFFEFDPKRVDFKGLPGVMALNENRPNTKYTIVKSGARRDINGEIIAKPIIIIDGVFDKFNIFASNGTSRPIVVKHLNSK